LFRLIAGTVAAPALCLALLSGCGPTAGAAGPTPSDSPTVAGLDQTVTDGIFSFAVQGVDCTTTELTGVENMFPLGQFCQVSITYTNIVTEARNLPPHVQTATASDGRLLHEDAAAENLVNSGERWVQQIEPGRKGSMILVFDVPQHTTLTSVVLHGAAVSEGAVVNVVAR
jgi:hypothetical protein